jgi:hypothetical protein
MKELLQALETVVLHRNPELTGSLRPGLSEAVIRRMLEFGNVRGGVEPIVDLFSWRNGSKSTALVTPEQPSLFPRGDYLFPQLDVMITQFRRFRQVATYRLRYDEVAGRYFPLLWNGAVSYLALDLDPSGNGRLAVIDDKAEKLVREAYPNFEAFVRDAIQANKTNDLAVFIRMSKNPAVSNAPLTRSASSGSSSGTGGTTFFLSKSRKKLPFTDYVPAVRTDFSDEAAWKLLCASIQDPEDDTARSVDFISDPEYKGLRADQLPALMPEGSNLTFAFIIDPMAFSQPDRPVLVVDLKDQPGRSFRVVASELSNLESNLSIANKSFDEFADAVDKNGIFHGF